MEVWLIETIVQHTVQTNTRYYTASKDVSSVAVGRPILTNNRESESAETTS